MILTILLILLVLWFIGYGPLALGNLVHLLLLVALIVVISDWIRTRPRGGDGL